MKQVFAVILFTLRARQTRNPQSARTNMACRGQQCIAQWPAGPYGSKGVKQLITVVSLHIGSTPMRQQCPEVTPERQTQDPHKSRVAGSYTNLSEDLQCRPHLRNRGNPTPSHGVRFVINKCTQ